jgi:hypothetical protein
MTNRTLNEIMEMDHVIRVRTDGTIDDHVTGEYAPEVNVNTDANGQISAADDAEMIAGIESQDWEVLNGWSGQYGYSGPIMHASEYVGGDLERHIRETPGLYCVSVVETLDDDDEPAGWIIMRKNMPDTA